MWPSVRIINHYNVYLVISLLHLNDNIAYIIYSPFKLLHKYVRSGQFCWREVKSLLITTLLLVYILHCLYLSSCKWSLQCQLLDKKRQNRYLSSLNDQEKVQKDQNSRHKHLQNSRLLRVLLNVWSIILKIASLQESFTLQAF